LSPRKISAVQRAAFKGRPRRAIPPVNRQKRERKAALDQEFELVEKLMHDASIRRAVESFDGLPREPMTVWTDSDHTWVLTELDPKRLPKWEDLTEFMKLFIGFDVGMEFMGGYSFTSLIAPELLDRWKTSRSGLVDNIEQNVRRNLDRQGIKDIPLCYVVETRSRSGKSYTEPHLHGYCLCETPLDATRLKVALEKGLNLGVTKRGTRDTVEVERSYDSKEEFIGRAVWVKYFTKNAGRWHSLLGRRRVYMSRSLTRLVRDAWGIRREE
jgi:hypothetical protein